MRHLHQQGWDWRWPKQPAAGPPATFLPCFCSIDKLHNSTSWHCLQENNRSLVPGLFSPFTGCKCKAPSLRPESARQRVSGRCRLGHCWLAHHGHRTWGITQTNVGKKQKRKTKRTRNFSVALVKSKYLRNTAWRTVFRMFVIARGGIAYSSG